MVALSQTLSNRGSVRSEGALIGGRSIGGDPTGRGGVGTAGETRLRNEYPGVTDYRYNRSREITHGEVRGRRVSPLAAGRTAAGSPAERLRSGSNACSVLLFFALPARAELDGTDGARLSAVPTIGAVRLGRSRLGKTRAAAGIAPVAG
jgi:hypothetical protein